MNSILSLGAAYLDINATNFPIPEDANALLNTETVGKDYEIELGGSAVNFVRFCKNLDLSAYFIGKTGQDTASTILKQLFEKESIHPLLSQDPSYQTNLNTNLVAANGTSLMLSFGNANQSLAREDVLSQLKDRIHDIDYVYLGGCFKLRTLLPSLVEIVEFVKSHNKKVVLDHGRVVNNIVEDEMEIMRNVIEGIDYYLPSKHEFLDLWNVKSIEEGLLLFEKTAITVVVKDAENGAWTIQESELLHVPAFPVTPINTIGAGDSFNAGFITAIAEGLSLEDAIRFANATAALKISQSKVPTTEMVDTFLLQQ